jgi:hypothetical protein
VDLGSKCCFLEIIFPQERPLVRNLSGLLKFHRKFFVVGLRLKGESKICLKMHQRNNLPLRARFDILVLWKRLELYALQILDCFFLGFCTKSLLVGNKDPVAIQAETSCPSIHLHVTTSQ